MSPRVVVDRSVCERHGQCVEQAPGIFSFDDAGELRYREDVRDDETATVEDAQFLCPTQAITLVLEP